MKNNTIKLQTLLCVIFGVASIATFFTNEIPVNDFFGVHGLARIAVYIIFTGLLIATFRTTPQIDLHSSQLPTWAKRLVVILPLLAIVFAIVNVALPEVSQLMRMADNDIFQRPGAAMRAIFQVAALVVFASLIPRFFKRKQWLSLGALVVLSLVLFVMAGEEISWGQRIFQWQTEGYFSAHNVQGETNLHNLATQLFQNSLFFGGFLLLVALPFFHDSIAALLHKVKSLEPLVNFLPESWMVLAFGAGLMFTDPFSAMYGVHFGSICMQLIATLMLLAALVYKYRNSGDRRLRRSVLLTMVAAVIVVLYSLAFRNLWLLNQGLPTEYIKLYISFGILCWAIRVRERSVAPLTKISK